MNILGTGGKTNGIYTIYYVTSSLNLSAHTLLIVLHIQNQVNEPVFTITITSSTTFNFTTIDNVLSFPCGQSGTGTYNTTTNTITFTGSNGNTIVFF